MNINQFIKYFRDGEKLKEDFKMGLEWECFIVNKDNLNIIPYHGTPGVEFILEKLAEKLELESQYDNGNIIALKGKNFAITLEPSGQIELSSGQFKKIGEFKKECELFINTLKSITEEYNLALMPTSYHPLLTTDDLNFIPKTRYNYLAYSFAKFGQHLAHDMMKLTTSIQLSIDYSSEQDFIKKIKTVNQLAPVMIAMYCNSPFKENKDSGFLSYRGHVWENTDKTRCGFIKGSFDPDFGYQKYVKTLLDLPMVIGFKDESPSELNGITYREYFQKHRTTLSINDWVDHISYLFTVVRAKQFIETRFYDNQQSLEMLLTVPALIKGLFYADDTILDRVYKLTYCPSLDKAIRLKQTALRDGLAAKYDNYTFLEAAQQILSDRKRGPGKLLSR